MHTKYLEHLAWHTVNAQYILAIIKQNWSGQSLTTKFSNKIPDVLTQPSSMKGRGGEERERENTGRAISSEPASLGTAPGDAIATLGPLTPHVAHDT